MHTGRLSNKLVFFTKKHKIPLVNILNKLAFLSTIYNVIIFVFDTINLEE